MLPCECIVGLNGFLADAESGTCRLVGLSIGDCDSDCGAVAYELAPGEEKVGVMGVDVRVGVRVLLTVVVISVTLCFVYASVSGCGWECALETGSAGGSVFARWSFVREERWEENPEVSERLMFWREEVARVGGGEFVC
jgi:hypothetical protein